MIGSKKLGIGGQGEFGLYVGINVNDEIDFGTYQTFTAVASTSAGLDGGLTFSYGNVFTDQLSGHSMGFYLDVDTLVDIGWTGEAVPGGIGTGIPSGTINSISITAGPELSAGILFGGGSVYNYTVTQSWNN